MKKSLIVELAGPGGVGKSTLAKALTERDERIQIGIFPNLRNIRYLPFFLWNTILLFPIFFAFWGNRDDKTITRQQMAVMMIVNGWHRRLTVMETEQNIIILDQGPVYMLAALLRFGPRNFRHIASNWWDRVCKNWANTLDMVICLDTSDSILMERVRARDKYHGIKMNNDQWAVQFLAQHRQAQHEVLNSFTNRGQSPKLLRIDTAQRPLNETIEEIFAHLVNKA